MKYLILLLVLINLSISTTAQQTANGSIIHDGIDRSYIIYIPENYNPEVAVPLLLNFHGYGSNAFEQMNYGDFRSIADTAGFIIVHPEGTLHNGITHWNVGGWTIGSTVDDIGFTNSLIDSLGLLYNIDNERVYSTGMSNGGFMSFLLACQLGNRIAAIASVTGSMTPETYNDCDPSHPTPILQIHGTADGTVPYNGQLWTTAINDVLDYWVSYNNCNTTPEIIDIPDIDPNDGSTVEHFTWSDGDNSVNTEHFKVSGGGHTWPGSIFGGSGTNKDINASIEAWNFLSRYDINGLIVITDIRDKKEDLLEVNIYPNPITDYATFEISSKTPTSVVLNIYNNSGRIIKTLTANNSTVNKQIRWNTKDVSMGFYYYRLTAGKKFYSGKLIVN